MSSLMCRYHPDKLAEFECAGCHKRFCVKCVREISDQYYCEVCESRLQVGLSDKAKQAEARTVCRL